MLSLLSAIKLFFLWFYCFIKEHEAWFSNSSLMKPFLISLVLITVRLTNLRLQFTHFPPFITVVLWLYVFPVLLVPFPLPSLVALPTCTTSNCSMRCTWAGTKVLKSLCASIRREASAVGTAGPASSQPGILCCCWKLGHYVKHK